MVEGQGYSDEGKKVKTAAFSQAQASVFSNLLEETWLETKQLDLVECEEAKAAAQMNTLWKKGVAK